MILRTEKMQLPTELVYLVTTVRSLNDATSPSKTKQKKKISAQASVQ